MGFLKKIFKPVSKVLDKIVPNELKPALPYLSAFAPMLMPTTGIFGSMLGRGLLSGGANLASQLAQEGNEGDANLLSVLMSGGIGALSAPGASDTIQKLRGTDIAQSLNPEAGLGAKNALLDKSLGYLEKGADYLSAAEGSGGLGDILRKGGVAPGLNMETAAALGIPLTQGAMDTAYNQAKLAERDFERNQGSGDDDEDSNRALAIRQSMEAYGFTEEEILDAIAAAGYKAGGAVKPKRGLVNESGGYAGIADILNIDDYRISEPYKGEEGYINEDGEWIDLFEREVKPAPLETEETEEGTFKIKEIEIPRILQKKGGRVGLAFGGIDSAVEQVDDVEVKENIKFAQEMDIPMEDLVEEFIIKFKRKPNNLDELKRFYRDKYQWKGPADVKMQETIKGRMTAKEGGVASVLPRGKEMDYRGGGMIPMGSRERADDVPARLSKNEFVMTADAVRAAGGGSVNEGARRMYNLMNNLEARA
jgi:hypothetical protein